jgi:hypothetical protein
MSDQQAQQQSQEGQSQSQGEQKQEQGPVVPKIAGTEMEIGDQSDNTPKEEKKKEEKKE